MALLKFLSFSLELEGGLRPPYIVSLFASLLYPDIHFLEK